MRLELHVYLHGDGPPGDAVPERLLRRIKELLLESETRLMTKIGDDLTAAVDELSASTDEMVVRVTGDVDALKTIITDLQDQLKNPAITPEEVARITDTLNTALAKVKGLDPFVPDVLPAP